MKKALIVTGTILGSLMISSSAFASTTHEVKDGDTLYKISKTFNTNVQELKSLNKLTSNLILPGQVLKVEKDTYVVKAGDSLSKIAKSHKTSVENLLKLNPSISNPDQIKVGQTIQVNEQVSVEKTYKVQLGDTLFKIAKANNTTVDSLMALNPEINNKFTISVGQTLKIAGQTVEVSKPASKPAVSTETKKQETSQKQESSPVQNQDQPKQETITSSQTVQNEEQPKQEVVDSTQENEVVAEPVQIQDQPKQETIAPSQPDPTPEQPKQETVVSSEAKADSIIAAGMKYLGTPYEFGASTSRSDAFDCSSFAYRAYNEGAGIKLPRTSVKQSAMGTEVSLNALQKGDLVFFDTDYDGIINHVGIYVGDDQMINATRSKGVVVISLHNSYWEPRIVKAMRIL